MYIVRDSHIFMPCSLHYNLVRRGSLAGFSKDIDIPLGAVGDVWNVESCWVLGTELGQGVIILLRKFHLLEVASDTR